MSNVPLVRSPSADHSPWCSRLRYGAQFAVGTGGVVYSVFCVATESLNSSNGVAFSASFLLALSALAGCFTTRSRSLGGRVTVQQRYNDTTIQSRDSGDGFTLTEITSSLDRHLRIERSLDRWISAHKHDDVDLPPAAPQQMPQNTLADAKRSLSKTLERIEGKINILAGLLQGYSTTFLEIQRATSTDRALDDYDPLQSPGGNVADALAEVQRLLAMRASPSTRDTSAASSARTTPRRANGTPRGDPE